jgi:hypothetical protein
MSSHSDLHSCHQITCSRKCELRKVTELFWLSEYNDISFVKSVSKWLIVLIKPDVCTAKSFLGPIGADFFLIDLIVNSFVDFKATHFN